MRTRAVFGHWALVGTVCAAIGLTSSCTASADGGSQSVGSTLQAAAGPLTIADQWVRATQGIADPSMSTVFAAFTNLTGKNLTIVSATNSLTNHTELRQSTMNGDAMVIGEAAGGIGIPAGATTGLDPNGTHITIMDLKSPIQPGDNVRITANLSDGSTFEFYAIGKDLTDGDESDPGTSSEPMTDMPGMSGMAGMDGMSGTATSTSHG